MIPACTSPPSSVRKLPYGPAEVSALTATHWGRCRDSTTQIPGGMFSNLPRNDRQNASTAEGMLVEVPQVESTWGTRRSSPTSHIVGDTQARSTCLR